MVISIKKSNLRRKRALITGVTGQDGAYLAQFLLDKGYEVFGTFRRVSTPNFWRLISIGVKDDINLVAADMMDIGTLFEVIGTVEPAEVYHLAAQSYVGVSFDMPLLTGEVDGLGCVRLLEVLRLHKSKAKVYIASTSEMYGSAPAPQNEMTPFQPVSPYAAAKLYAYWIGRQYREAYGMFICCGIMFNHESPIRGIEFVTRRITNAVARIKLGYQQNLYLGNLDARRDWGHASDYVEAMWLMLQQEKPDDYVVATGESHTVGDFCSLAFACAGLDWEKYVVSEQTRFRPVDVWDLRGDAGKANRLLSWNRRVSFSQLVKEMVEADLKRWTDYREGKMFPWDVLNSGDV